MIIFIDKINYAEVYTNIIDDIEEQFKKALDKTAKDYNITNKLLKPKNHLQLDNEGPITIDDKSYRASKLFFPTIDLATIYAINNDCCKRFCEFKNTKEYADIPKRYKKDLEFEFRNEYVSKLHKYLQKLCYNKKIARGEIGKKPVKPNYRSKDDYINSCVDSAIIKYYIDVSKIWAIKLDN